MLCGLVPGDLRKRRTSKSLRPRRETSSANNGEVDCFIKSGLKPAPRRNDVCPIGNPTSNRVQLFATGIAAPLLCAGDPGPLTNETDAKVLAEGSTLVTGGIGCVAFKSGLVCVNSKARGFLLSPTSARYF
jgi:hypothetical protein